MRLAKKFACCALGALLFGGGLLTGCNNPMFDFSDYEYPDYPLADRDDTIDSWTQWTDGEQISIDWFIDSPSYELPQSDSLVVQEIRRKTGITINFRQATSGTGEELTNLINGNDLPDLVSVTAGMDDLVNSGKIFPINGLAERWAPSLWRRVEEEGEMYAAYKDSEDDLYYLVNNFYNSGEMEEYRKLGGNILPNDGIVVRKDYLKAFCEHKKSENPAWEDKNMANPDGVLEFLLWAKKTYELSNANHSVLISAFDSNEKYGSRGIQVLMEYFSCEEEDANGNYVYPQASENFVEMMQWLNELYRNNLLHSGCLGATQTQINQYIQNGEPIMYIGKMITPASYFRNWERNVSGKNPAGEDAAYVPIIFTNESGQIPQLSCRTQGELFTMVSANCERPDRVIKLLDFLYSEEGQRLIYYGVDVSEDAENGTFTYAVQPGTKVTLDDGTEYVYKYGQMDYTQEVKNALQVNVESYGIYFCMFLCNPMYINLTSVNGGQFNNYRDYVKWNSRAALMPYSYDKRGFEFMLDTSDPRYKSSLTTQSNIRSKWYKKYAEIIGQDSPEGVANEIADLLEWCEVAGLSDYIAFNNDCFKAHKQRLGITYAWAPNDPSSGYSALTIDSVYGDTSYYKAIPDELKNSAL